MLCFLVFLLKSQEVLSWVTLPLAAGVSTVIKDQEKFLLKI